MKQKHNKTKRVWSADANFKWMNFFQSECKIKREEI